MVERKLTNRDLADIFYKLLEGEPVTRIADSYCVSAPTIYKRFKSNGVDIHSITVKQRSGIYPNLGSWMAENKIGAYRFAEVIGRSYEFTHQFLIGKVSPGIKTINKVLEVTGMTYEQAFATEQTEDEEES